MQQIAGLTRPQLIVTAAISIGGALALPHPWNWLVFALGLAIGSEMNFRMNMNTWYARLWQQFGHVVWAAIIFGAVANFFLHVSNQGDDKREKLGAVELPAPGSAEAAKAMIPAYLGQLLTVVDAPVVKGDTATVHARVLDQSCDLTLARNLTANESGWVVAKQNCKKL